MKNKISEITRTENYVNIIHDFGKDIVTVCWSNEYVEIIYSKDRIKEVNASSNEVFDRFTRELSNSELKKYLVYVVGINPDELAVWFK